MVSINRLMVVGLGNHGYTNTRHNIGFKAVDLLADHFSLSWTFNSNCKGYIASGMVKLSSKKAKTKKFKLQPIDLLTPKADIEKIPEFKMIDLTFFKPKQFMNVNGISVNLAMRQLKFRPNQIMAVQDDLERQLGKLSWKAKGSSNGHNGINSMVKCLGTQEFLRLRVGIDRPDSRDPGEVARYVLGSFSSEENYVIETKLKPLLTEEFVEKIYSTIRI